MSTMKRWRGLKALVQDAVEHGSAAIERIQKDSARRPFEILEQIPPIAVVARGVHAVHDTTVSGVHGMIREVNRIVGATLDATLDAIEPEAPSDEAAPDPEPEPPPASRDDEP